MNTISCLPNEILTYTFSFLEKNELLKTATVCKEWNETQKADSLWQHYCLAYLSDPQPYEGSWKERFKIIHNWLQASAEVKSYLPSCKIFDKSHEFTILEDNTPFEIHPSSQDPLIYIIRNWTHDTAIQIDLKVLNSTEIICSNLHDKTWIALNSQGAIFCFDIQTGECKKKIIPQHSKVPIGLDRAHIICNGQEIITEYNQEIKIWNADTCLLEQTIDISNLGIIWTLNSTTNYIVCMTYSQADGRNTFALRKDNHAIKKIDGLPFKADYQGICTSKNYLILPSNTGEIKVFKDSLEDLTLIHSFSNPPSAARSSHTTCIYQNWLLASYGGKLNIWDLETGVKLSANYHHTKENSEIRTNGVKWFSRVASIDHNQNAYYEYTLYSFEGKITQLNLPKQAVQIPSKGGCSII